MIRKATDNDLPSIVAIYDEIHDAEERGTLRTGWRRYSYPTRGTAEDALRRGDLFVCESDNIICASAVINGMTYVSGQREPCACSNKGVMVLHTLVVSPSMARKGIGSEFVAFFEKYASEASCDTLLVDTQEINIIARRFYAKCGFRETGIIECTPQNEPTITLVKMQKTISTSNFK